MLPIRRIPHVPRTRFHMGTCLASALMLLGLTATPGFAQPPELKLWPAQPPGQTESDEAEADTSGPDGRRVMDKPVIRLGHVSEPMLTVYAAPASNNTGAAVIVCPGGGYSILAYDLEGTEVCEWLQSIGVTGVLLKYRVPRQGKENRPIEPLQDAQRAVSLTRQHAAEWGIDPERIGVLGFSAGGHLSARLSTNYRERAYAPIDETDSIHCRPDFTILIYPAYLFDKESDSLVSSMIPVDEDTPPMFMAMAFDDGVGPENILRMGLALKKANVPCEVHLYPTGGHGFGLRRNEHQATSWPDRCAEWLAASGWLKSK
ncbi:alpha/beta hydrolase [Aureliella helgolandensis]|uniref:Acetylxylan esterase n=1 Tax=Aureliella helgolandensis TaxID=2527968 RepID=A0A518G0Q4_9BACT|nr:alpha/beta hydrolase [Aureliella helgolandensis]QDV22156.1 Acetylxylan esterase precursor [Aureliella helgolandensis]